MKSSESVNDLVLSFENTVEINWNPWLSALWPWNYKKPAVVPMALTDVTKLTLLQLLNKAHPVWASTVMVTFWILLLIVGSKYDPVTLVKSDWLGEHAYSHQNLFKLIAHISQPSPADPKIESICLYEITCWASLFALQQASLPLYYLHICKPVTTWGRLSSESWSSLTGWRV